VASRGSIPLRAKESINVVRVHKYCQCLSYETFLTSYSRDSLLLICLAAVLKRLVFKASFLFTKQVAVFRTLITSHQPRKPINQTINAS
jgi:hypothetical protein